MKKLLDIFLIAITVVTLVIVADAGIKEVTQYKELKQIKSNIESMIDNKGNMETVKEGRINTAEVKGDKIIITQNIGVYDYQIELNKDYDNIVNSILMYMTGYNAFNTDLKGIKISFS